MSDKFQYWKERTEKHDLIHDIRKINDNSCKQCYPAAITDKKFIRFWKWYREEIPEVEECTAKTEEFFNEYLEEGQDFDTRKWKRNNRLNNIRGKITKLLSSMRYSESPKITEQEIGERLIEMTVASNKFEGSIKKAKELWTEYKKTEKSDMEYSEENLIDKTITKRILKENEKIRKKKNQKQDIHKLKAQQVKEK